MNESIIKDLISIKLKMVDALVDKLPQELGNDVRRFQRNVMEALNEVSKEYLENKTVEKHGEKLKNVEIV